MLASLEHPVTLEGGQVVMEGRWRGRAARLGDLAYAGRVAPLRDDAGDALEDLPAALGVMPGHRRLLCVGGRCRDHSRTDVLMSTSDTIGAHLDRNRRIAV